MKKAFVDSAVDLKIVSARFSVIDTARETFAAIAEFCRMSGVANSSKSELAVSLLSTLASELSGGISTLLKSANTYSAGALLRQLVEVEYLMFQGYADPDTLGRWYQSSSEQIRRQFTPRKMREASDGLFQDQEYWLHCEVGGHPHPRARTILASYNSTLLPQAFLIPDAVHHIRRLWTSLKLLLPQIYESLEAIQPQLDKLSAVVKEWESVEDPSVLASDGIAVTP